MRKIPCPECSSPVRAVDVTCQTCGHRMRLARLLRLWLLLSSLALFGLSAVMLIQFTPALTHLNPFTHWSARDVAAAWFDSVRTIGWVGSFVGLLLTAGTYFWLWRGKP